MLTLSHKRFLVLLLFLTVGMVCFWHAMGDDLASGYVGCRVLAAGGEAQLYSHDPVNFAGLDDKDRLWPQQAATAGYTGYLHPYVQTPLWALALRPVCSATRWPAFKHLFLLLALAALGGSIFLVARFWAPALYRPLPIAVVLLLLGLSEPFLYAMTLVQTHALLLFLTVAGLLFAEHKRPCLAGLAVSLAAAVKLTPAVVLVYWLFCRRWRAAGSLVLWSAALLVLTRVVSGSALFHAYRDTLLRVSHVLLVAENNQSLPAVLMHRHFAPDEIFDVNAFALPRGVSVLSTALMLAVTAAGGLLDRRRSAQPSLPAVENRHNSIPVGAGMTLIAMTAFPPIAWTHYFVVLAIPLMLLTEAALRGRASQKWVLWATILLTAAPLYRPLAPDVVHMDLADTALLYGTFYSAMLCLVALLLSAWRQRQMSGASL